MSKFLLDANLSPKIARFLSLQLGLDVESLHGLRLGSIADRDVAHRGSISGRVVITQDGDFESRSTGLFEASGGVIYLDLPNEFRTIPETCRVLREFFEGPATQIDLDNYLVVITSSGVDFGRTIRRLRPRN